MNVLVVAKLSESKLLAKLMPLEDNAEIENIYLLRDEKCALPLSKVKFIYTAKAYGLFKQFDKLWTAIKFIKNSRIDLILSYYLVPHGYLAWLLSLLTNIPWLHAIIAGHRELWVNGKVIKKINVAILKKAAMIAVMGEKTKNYLAACGITETRITIIPNAIDKNIFYPDPAIEKQYDIVYAGRIDANKNLKLLIQSVKNLINCFPEVKVCIAGSGDGLEAIKIMVNDLGLRNSILFCGEIRHNEMCTFLNKGRIFTLMSYGEGVPMALLEAMFCGLACVATNVGEIENFLNHGKNGFLLNNPDDVDTFTSILGDLLSKPDLLKQISVKASSIADLYSTNAVKLLWSNCFKQFH